VKIARALLALSYATGLPVVAELGARAAVRRWGGYYAHPPYHRSQFAVDAKLFPRIPATARVEINSMGERGDSPPGSSERALRILCVGGSASECILLDQDATWSAVAQRLLQMPEHVAQLGVPRVHVGNASRAILRCVDIAFLLSKILPRYAHLDVIVAMVGGADVVSWVERGMPPTLAPTQLELHKIFAQHPEGPFGWRPSETALWHIARCLHRRVLRPVNRCDGGGWMRNVRQSRAEAPHRMDVVPDPAPMLDGFEEGLRALIAVARTRTERVVVVRQPWLGPDPTSEEEAMFWNFGLGRPYREPVSTYLTPRAVDTLMRAMDARSSAVAASEGVEQVDTMATLERSARTFYDELHLTPEGARVVGRLAAEGILASLRRRPLPSSLQDRAGSTVSSSRREVA
jgi:hypothetical protein